MEKWVKQSFHFLIIVITVGFSWDLLLGLASFAGDYYYAKTQDADCIPDTDDSEKREICLTYKRIEIEEYQRNFTSIEECKNAEKKNLCIFLLARETSNVNICKTEIEGFTEHEMCINNLAIYYRDASLCNYLSDTCSWDCKDKVNFSIEGDKKGYGTIILSNACPLETAETYCVFKNCDTELLEEIIKSIRI